MPNNCLCWVISLNPQAENTQKLINDLQAQGINAEVFPAIDGRDNAPVLEGGERLRNSLAMVRHRKCLTGSELGCYLSHLRAVKKAYAQGSEYVCLLEDDVLIEPIFAEVLHSLLSKQLDMVRLMSLRLRRRRVLGPLAEGHYLMRPERGGLGTQSYLLNRLGMKKFIDHAEEIYEPIDKVFDHFFLFDLRVFSVEPHVAQELVHDSSVAKLWSEPARDIKLWHRLAYHPVKLWFSLRRRVYRLRHRAEFAGAVMPDKDIGKTERLR
jgi:glycosyl transferase family 25